MKYILGSMLILTTAWVAGVYAFPWVKDMFFQQNIQPYEIPGGRRRHLPLPKNSISIDDTTAGMTRKDFEAIAEIPSLQPLVRLKGAKPFLRRFASPAMV